MFADERLMSVALTGAAGAMWACSRERGRRCSRCGSARTPATRLLAIQFAQDLVAAPDVRQPAKSGQALPDWPGGDGASWASRWPGA